MATYTKTKLTLDEIAGKQPEHRERRYYKEPTE